MIEFPVEMTEMIFGHRKSFLVLDEEVKVRIFSVERF